jgi:peptidoglycan/LPS O-acetylase OafA/YrhL
MQYRSIMYLRGLAAFFVAYGHLTYGFFDRTFLDRDVGPAAALVLSGTPNNIPPAWLVIPNSGAWVNVFFLISGFVIEMSIQRVRPLGFLIQRALRIYPIFWIGWLLQVGVSWWVLRKPLDPDWLDNLTLLDKGSFVPVSWTLIFEIHFYIFVAASAALGLRPAARASVANLMTFAVIGLELTGHTALLGWQLAAFLLANGFYIAWMTIGTALFWLFDAIAANDDDRQRRAWRAVILQCFIVFLQFSLITISPLGKALFPPGNSIWFTEALAIFTICLFADRYIWKLPILDWLGRISYPLYCIHFSLGWALHLVLVAKFHLSPLYSLAWVLLLVLGVSDIIHRLVEKPLTILGKTITYSFRYETGKPSSRDLRPEPSTLKAQQG